MNKEIRGTLQNPQIKTKAPFLNTRDVESLDLTPVTLLASAQDLF